MPYIIFSIYIIKLYFYKLLSLFKPQKYYYKKSTNIIKPYIPFHSNKNKKPLWVKHKVIYLKALLPKYGCRKIAILFNKQYQNKNISISKSFVYNIIKTYHYEIVQKRKYIKNHIPKRISNNHIWSIDLTNITDINKSKNTIFGIIDNGSRAILYLQRLKDKSTISILKSILNTIELYGKPKIIKSDNEINFKSKLFKFALFILGIKHQTSQVASPWQNGKIERFFGTMKFSFNQLDL